MLARVLSDRDRQRAEESRDENPEVRWEYKARNLGRVPGIALENDFNKMGAKGWEFVAMVSGGREGYAIFKRRL